MRLAHLQAPKTTPVHYMQGSDNERMWIVTEDLYAELSDGSTLHIPTGYVTDLRSSPKFLWSVLPPFNDTLLAWLIHDYLWTSKMMQFSRHVDLTGSLSVYEAFVWSNDEMLLWANALAPHRKRGNRFSYFMVNHFGMKRYTGQKKILA